MPITLHLHMLISLDVGRDGAGCRVQGDLLRSCHSHLLVVVLVCLLNTLGQACAKHSLWGHR